MRIRCCAAAVSPPLADKSERLALPSVVVLRARGQTLVRIVVWKHPLSQSHFDRGFLMSHRQFCSQPRARLRANFLRWFTLPVCLLLVVPLVTAFPPAATHASPVTEEPTLLSAEQPSGSGTIIGAAGGAFREFWFTTPGGHRSVSLQLDLARGTESLGEKVGVNVYRATDGAWTARGVPVGGDPRAVTAIASVSSSRPQLYLAQVFSYLAPGAPVHFGLNLDFSPVAGTAEPRGAPVLYADAPVAAGRVDGLGAGSGDASSAYYLLAYPGRFQELDVTIAFSGSAKEIPRIVSTSVGAYLWAGRKLIACSGPAKRLWTSSTGPVNGTLNLFGVPVPCNPPVSRYRAALADDPANFYAVSEGRVLRWAGAADARELGLQIFNYKSSGPPGRVDYAVSARGLRPRVET